MDEDDYEGVSTYEGSHVSLKSDQTCYCRCRVCMNPCGDT